jgi:hypothetical protein
MCTVIPGRAFARTRNLALIISGFRACLLRRHPGMTTAKQIQTIPLRENTASPWLSDLSRFPSQPLS